MTLDDVIRQLDKEKTCYEEFHRDPGFGRGSCTTGWLITKHFDNCYEAALSQNDGNYAGGESRVRSFSNIRSAYNYCLDLKKEFLERCKNDRWRR